MALEKTEKGAGGLLGAVLGTQTEKCKPKLGLHPGILEAWPTMGTGNAPGEGSIMCLEV